MSSHTLLSTITEMEARLGEMRQQLVQSLYVSQPQQPQHPSCPPGFGPRPTHRDRVPYSMISPSVRAVPLQSHRAYSSPHPHPHPHSHPRSSYVPHSARPSFQTVSLSDVLQRQEEVLLRIMLRKGSQEEKADLVTVFDGAKLTVTRCELIPSLVGTSVVKPGEILYRFMEELHSAGHLKRTFTVAPWKLCSVVREGVTHSLEELRRQHLNQV